MRTFALGVVLALPLACTKATPPPTPEPPAEPPPRAPAAPAPAPVDRSVPPVEGIDYWATPTKTPEQFLAQARAAGLRIERTVEVTDIEGLLRALAPNTAVVLAPGRYVFEDSDRLAEPAVKAELPDWSALSRYYDDGRIHDIHDLILMGAGPEPAVLLQPDTYAPALTFERVHDIALHDLTIGHRPLRGGCQGGVVRVIEGNNLLITDSTLFGSGTEGLSLVTVDGLRLQDSVITDSSEQFSTISQSREIVYERVRVMGNRGDLLRGFAIHHSSVQLIDTQIADNTPLRWRSADSYGLLFAIDGPFDWGRWFVEEPRRLEPDRRASEVILRNTSIDGELHDRTL